MKALLGALMCLVFTMTQAFAISGGPFGGNSHVVVTGIYAGAFVPLVPPGDDSLALFTLTIPKTGGGTGATVVFRNGLFYAGVIDAVGDPDPAKVSAVINATVGETVTCNDCNGVAHDYMFTFNANGKFETVKAVGNQQSVASSSVRLRGKASLTYATDAMDSCDPTCIAAFSAAGTSGGPIEYKVKGFKQAEASN